MQKETYERPVIIKHQSGLANKFGRSRAMRTMSQIDGIPVSQITEKYGSPVFVFSEETIRRNYRQAYRSFSMRYPKVQFAWSYKTNYMDAICRIFHSEGSWAEVVSEYEYEMAVRNGITGDRIIYNGPYKPCEFLRKAVDDGAHIHVDNYDELCTLEKIAREENKAINLSLRLNMDTGIYPSWDRFGFNYDSGEAMAAARRMFTGGKLNLVGVHAHIGTCVLDPAAYKIEVEKLVAFVKGVESQFDFAIEYIDIGGGFPSNSTLHEQYTSGDDANPPVDAYAEIITSALLASYSSSDSLPLLILETGRALIDNAGYMITSVVANKRLANGARSIIVDAGVNTLLTSFWYKHNVYPEKETSAMLEETIIYGPLCMNIDVIRPSIRLPSMNIGDLLVLAPVGAYNVTQWLQFIRMRPAVVLIGENNEVVKIRDKENIDAIKHFEHIPEWLDHQGFNVVEQEPMLELLN